MIPKPQVLIFKTSSEERKESNKNESTTKKDIDLKKIKELLFFQNERLKEEQFNSNSENQTQTQNGSDYRYESFHKQYMNEVYGVRIMSFIVRLVKNGGLSLESINKYQIHSILLKISKYLLLNEIELCVFSLFLDRLGWENEDFQLDDYLLLVAILTKMNTCDYSHIIINTLTKQIKGLEVTIEYFIKTKIERQCPEIVEFSVKDVNRRYILYSKPFNSYCKENFIDYNFCVDQILSMSLPYSTTRKHMKKSELLNVPNDNISVSNMIRVNNPIINDNGHVIQNLIGTRVRNNPFASNNSPFSLFVNSNEVKENASEVENSNLVNTFKIETTENTDKPNEISKNKPFPIVKDEEKDSSLSDFSVNIPFVSSKHIKNHSNNSLFNIKPNQINTNLSFHKEISTLYPKFSNFLERSKEISTNTIYDLPSQEVPSFPYPSFQKNVSDNNQLYYKLNSTTQIGNEQFGSGIDINSFLNFKRSFVDDQILIRNDSMKSMKFGNYNNNNGHLTNENQNQNLSNDDKNRSEVNGKLLIYYILFYNIHYNMYRTFLKIL